VQPEHPPIILLSIRDAAVRQLVQRALYGRAVARQVERASQLVREAELLEMGALILDSGSASDSHGAIADHVALRFPHLPVMRVEGNPPPSDTRGALRSAGEAPADARTTELRCRLEALLAQAFARSAAGRMQAIVDDMTPPLDRLATDFLLQAAHAPRAVCTVTILARRIGSSVRTLEQHLSAGGLPTAHVLFWTIMVLRAAILLQDPRCTLRRVSTLLPFPDPPAVSVRFRRYVGANTRDVRSGAALDGLWHRFALQLSGASLGIVLSSDERDRLRTAAQAEQVDEGEWARRAILRALDDADERRAGAFAQRSARSAIDRSA
jgi:hypothetical protein